MGIETSKSLWMYDAHASSFGGMGAMAPMATRHRPCAGSVRVARPEFVGMGDTRLDQQKKTPASAGTTPGALTNIGDCNVDRADCRS